MPHSAAPRHQAIKDFIGLPEETNLRTAAVLEKITRVAIETSPAFFHGGHDALPAYATAQRRHGDKRNAKTNKAPPFHDICFFIVESEPTGRRWLRQLFRGFR